jgi:hypothetical protein
MALFLEHLIIIVNGTKNSVSDLCGRDALPRDAAPRVKLVGTRSCAIRHRTSEKGEHLVKLMGKASASIARSQKQQKEASRRTAPDARERIPTSAGGAARSYHFHGALGFRDGNETDVLQLICYVSVIAKRSGFSRSLIFSLRPRRIRGRGRARGRGRLRGRRNERSSTRFSSKSLLAGRARI